MRMIGAMGLGFCILLLLTCGTDRFPDYHYKMTVYVGNRAYSSVRAVEAKEVASIIDSSGRTVKTSQQGEAVILDLGNGKIVYALLSGVDSNSISEYGFAGVALSPHIPKKPALSDFGQAIKEYRDDHSRGDDGWDARAEEAQQMVQVKGPKDLPRTIPNHDPYRGPREIPSWPMFVTFGDSTDPKTVREVSPDSISVKRITIEITDEDVTTKIEGLLPNSFWARWEAQHKQAVRDRGGFMNPGDDSYFKSLSGRLSRSNFIVGGDK